MIPPDAVFGPSNVTMELMTAGGYRMTATDSAGRTGTLDLTIIGMSGLVLSPSSRLNVGDVFSATVTTTQPLADLSGLSLRWTIDPPLPPGSNFSVDPIAGVFSGTISAPGNYTITASTPCGNTVSTSVDVRATEIAFELVDLEGTIDANPNGADASGINLSSVSFVFNGVTIDRSRWTVTDVTGTEGTATFVIGKRIKFTPLPAELAPSGDDILVVSCKDNAGNPLDPRANTLHFRFGK